MKCGRSILFGLSDGPVRCRAASEPIQLPLRVSPRPHLSAFSCVFVRALFPPGAA